MIAELQTYQACPSRETLGEFWLAAEPVMRKAAHRVLTETGRGRDAALLDAAVSESAYRVVKMAGRLRTLRVASEAALKKYLREVGRGAAMTAIDDPTAGPTRRNAKRQKESAEPMKRESWPRESAASIKDRTENHTNLNGPRVADSPKWTHAEDRGQEWWTLVVWVAAKAKALAVGAELVAVNQTLAGRTDRETAAALGMARQTWTDHRSKLLAGLAPRIAAAADWRMDEIGEKYLGKLWIDQANRGWVDVLLREAGRAA